jgi:1,4-dihydroxy-2-naphthoate octaprenyltransferase
MDILDYTTLMPSPEMSDDQRLSCIIKFIIIITFLLYVFISKSQDWIWFLGLSVICVYIIWSSYGFVRNYGKTPTIGDK